MRYGKVFLDAIGCELAPNVITSASLEERIAPVYKIFLKMAMVGSILLFGLDNSLAVESGWLKLSGYKGAKWGMSPAQVGKALNLPWKYSELGGMLQVGYRLEEALFLQCFFHHKKLYRVEVPFFSRDQKTADVEMVLKKKYGDSTSRGTQKIVWDDGKSRITLHIFGDESYASNVVYENLAMGLQAEREKKSEDEKEQERHKKKNLEQLNDRL